MFIPPLMTLLQGEGTPTPFYSSARILNGDWFTVQGPGAIYYSNVDKTFVAWQMVGTDGFKGTEIAAYDHATQTWSERYRVGNYSLADDNHGGAAIVRDAEGFFHVFFGAHATTQPWSISTAANSITAWTPQAPLGTALTYPHACLVGSTIYVFWRNDVTLSRRTLVMSSTTPSSGTATFAALTTLVDFDADSRAYPGEAIVVGTDIHIVCTRANAADTERKGVYYFVYDTTSGALKNHDGSVSTASGSLPISLATANASYRLFNHGTGRGDIPSLCFDTGGDPHLVFVDNGGSGTTFTLKHMKRTSGTWSSTTSIATVGVTFPGIGYVATYSAVTGASSTIEAWYTDSTGSKIRQVRSSSGVWSAAQTILTAGANPLDDNQSVRDGKSDFRVIFGEISTSFNDSGAILSDRYGYGDSGPITAAVPMIVQDSLYSSVSLLLGFESRDATTRMINEADTNFIGTANGNAQVDTAQSKFGSASLLLDGTGDFVSFSHNSLMSISNGDFTFECWVRRNAAKLQCIVGKRPSAGSSEYAFYISAANQLILQAYSTTVAVINITGTTALSSTSTWYHVAATRSGTTWRCFLDGNLEASGTESASPSSNSQSVLIGRDASTSTRDFNGWIDEVRFTSGTARYTASFTAPSAAFPRR